MRSDITPGGIFPDFALPDQVGAVRTLGELQGRYPLILAQSSHAQTGKTTTAYAGRPDWVPGARGWSTWLTSTPSALS
jgi:hypothetical protein